MRGTRWPALLLGLLAAALLAGACAPAPEVVVQEREVEVTREVEKVVEREKVVTPTAAPARDVMVVALSEGPPSLDPADHRSRISETVIRNMFDGLVTRDTTSGVHLEIAESLEWLDDVTLEARIRQGIKFHNGEDLTAEDVVFTFERIITENAIEHPEPHTSPRKGLIAPLESVEQVDDYTVRFHFSGPWPVAEQLLVHQQIVPRDYLEEVGTRGFVERPVGAGPFRFVSARLDSEIVLERFDDYWGGAPTLPPVGAACVSRVVFRVIPETSTRVAALLAGEVDIIQAVPAELAETLAQTPGIQVKTAPGTQPKWMELNVNSDLFADLRVRQAFNYAVDKQLLIETIYGGRGVLLGGVLSPFNNYAHPGLEPFPYDPDRALALLAEAGWVDSDGDGLLDRGGQPLAFTIDTLAEHRALAEALSGLLRELGIDTSVRVWEFSVVRDALYAGERLAYVDDWGDSAFDPVGHMEAKWHSLQPGSPYGRGNFSTYANARVDELIRAAETTADSELRRALYYEAQEILYQEVPAVFLVLPEETEAARADIVNWEPASDSRINLHDVCIGG